MKIYILLSIPFISAMIGWVTNFIAVRMIFRPRKEIRFLWFRIQGLIPKRKKELAEKIAHTVETELISHRDIKEIIKSENFHIQTGEVIRSKIESFITSKIAGNPLLGMFLTPEVTSKLSTSFMEELHKEIPGVIDALFEKVESKIDFRDIIKNKIDGFDPTRLESIVYNIASHELKAIEFLGGVLGFVVGLVQLGIILVGEMYG